MKIQSVIPCVFTHRLIKQITILISKYFQYEDQKFLLSHFIIKRLGLEKELEVSSRCPVYNCCSVVYVKS